MEIYKKFSFDSAHYLPNLPDDHKCRRMHGHTFYVTVFVKGSVDPKIGWIKDFFEIKQIFQPILERPFAVLQNAVEKKACLEHIDPAPIVRTSLTKFFRGQQERIPCSQSPRRQRVRGVKVLGESEACQPEVIEVAAEKNRFGAQVAMEYPLAMAIS